MGFHSPLIRPAICWGGGSFGGGTLGSHDTWREVESRYHGPMMILTCKVRGNLRNVVDSSYRNVTWG